MQWSLAAAGLAIHIVFFYSIFDIYFTSPLVHGMRPVVATGVTPPARRLVLFVMDGLRADKLLELDAAGRTRAPFLRDIMMTRGAWGVSHTRVPTESRPGHVALIAGFYEDVGAIAKGWKENPVDFDSVFNQSRHTWSWGSPDILPMFAKGAQGDHVVTYTYSADQEDFGGANLSKLDTWVFDRVKTFLDEAKRNSSLGSKLRSDKVILFLHLLGLDTNGHAHKPYSTEYLSNIGIADDGIREISGLVDAFFDHDAATAYVVTSDHGMTNWGSHGAGHDSETMTPLIVWGAGVRSPISHDPGSPQYPDGLEHEWKLSSIRRSDVNQADVCALMAALIGVPFPVNSVGILPLDYLSLSEVDKAEQVFANAQQMLAQFEVKMREKRETTLAVLFTPFKHLTLSIQADKTREIRKLISDGEHTKAISRSQDLISLALSALSYYHHYDRFFLGLSITLGFLGWISYIFTLIVQQTVIAQPPRLRLDRVLAGFWCSPKGTRVLAIALGAVITALIYIQSLPAMHYVYCLVPIALWHKVLQKVSLLRDVYCYVVDHRCVGRCLAMGLVSVCGLEIIVLSFFWRQLLSIGLVALAGWPLLTTLRHSNKCLSVSWALCCLLLAVFPLLPVVGRDTDYNLVLGAGFIAMVLAIYLAFRPETGIYSGGSTALPRAVRSSVQLLTLCQMALMVVAVYVVWSTSVSLGEKQGLPLSNQIASWVILATSFVLPLFSASRVYTRLLSIGLAFMPPFLLLSTAHEGLFYLVLCLLLVVWLQVEYELQPARRQKLLELEFCTSFNLVDSERQLMIVDLQTAYIFVYLLITAFFGTGNIASVNSFDPTSVHCFLTVFNPFTMAALMMWKIFIPFLLVTCAFIAVHSAINVPMQSLFLVVLLMSDYMGLHFFFLVQDYGSWLDIGTSISHYVIVMLLICFLFVLLSMSRVFTGWRLRWPAKHHNQ